MPRGRPRRSTGAVMRSAYETLTRLPATVTRAERIRRARRHAQPDPEVAAADAGRPRQEGLTRVEQPSLVALERLREHDALGHLEEGPSRPLLGEPARAADRRRPVTPARAELPRRAPPHPATLAPSRRPRRPPGCDLGLLVDEPQLDERVVAPLVDRESPVLEDAVLERPVLGGVVLERLEGELDLSFAGVDQGLHGHDPARRELAALRAVADEHRARDRDQRRRGAQFRLLDGRRRRQRRRRCGSRRRRLCRRRRARRRQRGRVAEGRQPGRRVVRHRHRAAAVDGDAARLRKAAEGAVVRAVRAEPEQLPEMVGRDVHRPVGIDGYAVRIGNAPAAGVLAVGVEGLDAPLARVGDVDGPVRAGRKPARGHEVGVPRRERGAVHLIAEDSTARRVSDQHRVAGQRDAVGILGGIGRQRRPVVVGAPYASEARTRGSRRRGRRRCLADRWRGSCRRAHGHR